MEIETATNFTLSALTLREKSLAHDLLYSEQYHKVSGAVWLRAPVLHLNTALARARKEASSKDFTAKFINLYCDTLVIDPDTQVLPEHVAGQDEFLVLEIFARKLESPAHATAAFHVRFIPEMELLFWVSHLPEDFQVSYRAANGDTGLQAISVVAGGFGVLLRSEESTSAITTEQLPAPDTAMQNINYMDLITDDGKLKDKRFQNDDLPRLLQFQMLVAQANTSFDLPLALSLLDYVIAASSTPLGAQLNYQASALRSSLTVSAEVMSVPSVNIYSSKQVLKARLLAAMAFEQAFREYMLEAATRKIQKETAMNMLAKSQDALQTYQFLRAIRQREYENAIAANDKAGKNFELTQQSLEKLARDFQKGIEQWKQEQVKGAIKDILLGIVAVGVAIGATVATAGAAAPAVAVAGAKVVNTATKVAQLIAKLKELFDRIKKIYEKIKPVIEKLQVLLKTIKTVIDALQNFGKATGGTKTLKPSIQSTDVFNATAEWRRFDIVIRDMEKSLEEYRDIQHKNEYFQALKIMVVNGETYILTQANLVQKGDELATIIVQQTMETRDEGRLAATASNVENDAAVLNALTRAMFDRILAVRSMVYLDFSAYMEAYRYHTLIDEAIVHLSPVKPVADYLEDMAKLQGAVASFGSRVMVQQRVFKISTLCGFGTPKDLADVLGAGQVVEVSVRPDEAVWYGFDRIRLSRARCWLDGVQPSSAVPSSRSALPLRLKLRSGSQFFDHAPLPQPDLYNALTSSGVRTFVGASRTIIFEYQPGTRNVLCDGNYGQQLDYTKHTPMTNWTVQLQDDGADLYALGDLDFAGFQGITMEFLCDFTWRG